MPILKYNRAFYQESPDGPLKQEVRDRMNRLREEKGYTMASLGTALGFSGPFMSTLLRDSGPASIRTKHMKMFMQKLIETEKKEGIYEGESEEQPVIPEVDDEEGDASADFSLEYLILAINKKGFSVTLKQMDSGNH